MKKFILTLAAILFISGASMAKGGPVGNGDSDNASHRVNVTIPTVAILDIEGAGNNTTVTLTPEIRNLDAGSEVDFSSSVNSNLSLNYTSIVTNGKKKKITVKIDKDLKGSRGYHIGLSVGTCRNGHGSLGTAKQNIELSETTTDIVTDIASCYSGNGAAKGRQLTYSLVADDYSKLYNDNYGANITVTYTIVDQN